MVKIKLFILTLFFGLNLFAQEVEAIAKTDSSNYVVGDYINYVLEVKHPENVKILIPSVQDSIKVLEFIKKHNPVIEPAGDYVIERFKYTFSAYDSTEVLIPSFLVNYKVGNDTTLKSVATNELFVFIDKVTVDPEKDIMDIKEPLLIPFDLVMLLIIILIALVLIASGYLGYKQYKKRKTGVKESKPEIIIPPFEEAYSSLKQLDDKQLWQNGEVKEFHTEITFIIRKYFERSFNFLALEMPSSEVLDNLKNVKECGSVHDNVRDFFTNADMVKFAKFIPINSVNEEMMQQAFTIIEKTKPLPVEEIKAEEVQNV